MNQPDQQVRVSLQTKLLAVIALILTVVLAANSLANYYRASAANEALSRQRLESLFATFTNLVERSTRQFERSIGQISGGINFNQNAEASLREIGSLFPELEGLRAHTLNGHLLGEWHVDQNLQFPEGVMHSRAMASVTGGQQPYSRIYCLQRCLQATYVPALDSRGNLVVVSAVRTLNELLLDFEKITSADIALLQPARDAAVKAQPALATHADVTVPLASEINRLSGFLESDGMYHGPTSRGIYMARSAQLPSNLTEAPLRAAILIDDTTTLQFMRHALTNWLITGALALLATVLLAYIALRRSLKKLVNLSNVIPMLSDSDYDELRRAIRPYAAKSGLLDEVDQLNLSVLAVADALEEMEEAVARHRDALVGKISELRETQDFNDILVNDSPLVIVAHTPDGRIKLLNDYGRELSGWTESDIHSRRVWELILPDLSGHGIQELLRPLTRGRETRIQTEQLLVGTGNKVHDLTWMHATVNTDGENMILSVGLDITERRKTESRLRWLSRHDNVTDLLNREAFHEEAGLLIQQYGDTHHIDFAVMDIDKFAAINDMYGFQNGDAVLKEAARYIERLITNDTIIARTGPNEFSALIISPADASDELNDIPDHPLVDRNLRFYSVLNDDAVEVTLTGVLGSYPQDGHSIDELVSNAAAALRKLTPVEKGKVSRIVEAVDNRALRQERMQIHDDIVRALTEERFILLFQPIYDLGQERISHCECLVRMRADDGHLVSPGAFMDIAREHGLMARLDLLVMRMALVQLKSWERQGLELKLSVNITAATFESDHFIKELKKLLLETGASAQRLIFEIVETEAINNLATAQELCQRLRELDVQIAFDDFGIGFTSFEYLRDLPVDYIKIDQSFIRYLYKRKSDQLLVKSMVDMALALGKKIIAEGVEDDGSADILRAMGVHYLQGYLISRPRHSEDLELNFRMGIN